ncbi:chondroitin sulfate proteoglycan 5-like isoform X2 [Thalassophryne amazonica]|uniref:chondroitin sulfate proteoglycan 5-like isoform X2 n=1 Tax=Thalassophryne amazonica TaxID=390379 RepID=UPI00147224C8|nr:chondroitin sulfate proteoglycan 5-like isoform X2 [Thalassophryne amazonica]
MARRDARLGTWRLLLTILAVILPLSTHGRHSLTKRHHHHNHSSVNKEAASTRMVLSDESAERDHLIGARLGMGARLPLSPKRHYSRKHLNVIEEDPPVGEELTAGGAGPDQPGNPLSDDIITVEFHSPAPDVVPSNGALDWAKAPKAQKQKAGDPATWKLSDFYDYLSPDDDLSAFDTTPEPEPTPLPPADMEDENPLLAAAPPIPNKSRPNVNSKAPLPAPPIPGPDKGEGLSVGGATGPDGCRLGFVLSGPGVCVPQCEVEPNFCLNGGVCTVAAGIGAFCRCNVQDYIWNKGMRCDWMVTEFQVMCVVVSVSSLVLLLLFMIIVVFAKKLYQLKNENRHLCKRSKFQPQSSEPQTDDLSVSTTADGSQPNDEPQKKEEPEKSPQAKEEGSMNILNSHSPQNENNRPTTVAQDHDNTPNNTEENAEDGATLGLEVLLPKDAKLHPQTSPPLQYDKLADSEDPASVSSSAFSSHAITPPTATSSNHPKSPKTQKLSTASESPRSPKDAQDAPRVDCDPDHQSSLSCHSVHHSIPANPSSSTPPSLRRPKGHPASGFFGSGGHIYPSPSSPHLGQPPPSPSRVKCSPVSTRSLPPLS